jgi:hypothetical protein
MKYMEIPQEKLNKAVGILINDARNKRLIAYAGLYEQIDLDHANPIDRQLGSHILGAVSRASLDEKGVMLSSLVFGRVQNEPAEGFYDLAQELNKLGRRATQDEKTEFWIKEVRRCWDAYAV